MISAEEHVALESKAEDLKSESWERREEAVQQLLTPIPTRISGHCGGAPDSLARSPAPRLGYRRAGQIGLNLLSRKRAGRQLPLLAQVGYPAAWQAKEALERVKDITWRLVTWTSGARTSLFTLC